MSRAAWGRAIRRALARKAASRAGSSSSRSRFQASAGRLFPRIAAPPPGGLLRCAGEGRPPVLDALLHPALFVPEHARVSEVLRELQHQHRNLALVVDEYGRTVGLVTVEDCVEEIVGEIREDRESGGPPVLSRLPDGAYVIDGTATIRDLREAGLPLEESTAYQTLAGFLLHTLQTVPQPGAVVTAHSFVWTVVDMDGARIATVRAEPVRA